jgi:histone-lysine N-methyltransferase SETMAR
MLGEELKPAIRGTRRGMLTNGVVMHHDNARPHIAVATVETIRKLKSELLLYSVYSPDLILSDYHICGPLENALRGRRFADGEKVKDAVHTCLRSQPKTFFADGITKYVDRSNGRVKELWIKSKKRQHICSCAPFCEP